MKLKQIVETETPFARTVALFLNCSFMLHERGLIWITSFACIIKVKTVFFSRNFCVFCTSQTVVRSEYLLGASTLFAFDSLIIPQEWCFWLVGELQGSLFGLNWYYTTPLLHLSWHQCVFFSVGSHPKATLFSCMFSSWRNNYKITWLSDKWTWA